MAILVEGFLNRKQTKIFDALESLMAMFLRVPNRGEQMVCTYGHYSNACREK